jgi:hypothetical protein
MPLLPSTRAGHPHVSSFLGVSFGESLDDVHEKYPTGREETSPYGAPAYRIDEVSAGNVRYNSVVYEFADGAGMQLVYARFAPGSADYLLKELKGALGEPVSMRSALGKAHDSVEATWLLPEGELVKYDSELDRLAILGPRGEGLREDIRLRDKLI